MPITPITETVEYRKRREQIEAELRKNTYKPKTRSFEMFKKTVDERLNLDNLKLKHSEEMRKRGYNRKKRMNVFEPVRAVIW